MFRQVGDQRLVGLLNSIRDGRANRACLEQLNLRLDRDFTPPEDEFWVTMATTNNIVKSRNRRRLEEIEGELYVSQARSWGDLSSFDFPNKKDYCGVSKRIYGGGFTSRCVRSSSDR